MAGPLHDEEIEAPSSLTRTVDGDGRWLRVSWPGSGGRNIDLNRLAEIAADDAGWERLCALFAGEDDPAVAELLERVRVVQAAFIDVSAERDRLATLVEILAGDQPDGEEFDAAEKAIIRRFPVMAGERLLVERLATVALDAAWAVNHTRRAVHRRRDGADG